ncbi:hypothetical protein Lal_00022249 [Lupinus albus]|nr:hypothetical protein Lal_00022249 [Lupinus albus]
MKNVFAGFVTLIAVLLLLVESGVGKGINSDDELKYLLPCIKYVTGLGGETPSADCCHGVKAIEASATTIKNQKIGVCDFLKEVAFNLPEYKEEKANTLFRKCGVNFQYPFSKDARCQL